MEKRIQVMYNVTYRKQNKHERSEYLFGPDKLAKKRSFRAIPRRNLGSKVEDLSEAKQARTQ